MSSYYWFMRKFSARTSSVDLIDRTVAEIHFRIEQMEAVLAGCSAKDLRAAQSRSVSSSCGRAMKSQTNPL
jgi:hypothetical protein